jgi:hypothetical protein
MIPSTNSKLLVAEDWKKIYQSFRNADFKSYDFETLRRTMITYLQENYPEDFNDFIDSSEYIALIDLIAYLGQNLSFRIDLNARENFLETAQRRDSVLRLAQLVSYVPKRNTPANGFLKLTAVSTTDNVVDSNGINLANTTIGWNDSTNISWYQQFITIMNSAMPGSYTFGNPYGRSTINGILTERYKINSSNTDVPLYSFQKNINGSSMSFEVVSCSFEGSTTVYEEAPKPANTFGLLYQNDNKGASSSNTGFFAHFRQGSLSLSNFSLDNPVPNEIVGVNTSNINDTDVWLWQLDANNNYTTLWTKVNALVGSNIIYNSLNNDIRNIYSVTTRDQDQIDLNFADGSFGNLPKGQFGLFYRQSNGATYTIKPEQMSGIVVQIPYKNKVGQQHVLTLTLSLQYTVNNSAGPESNTNIRTKAPQTYYTQNRMVTGEDYNIVPLTLGSNILKVKSIARVTGGLSKYFDLSDITGKYSQTNIFASDGMVYQQNQEQKFEFTFTTRNDVFSIVKKKLEPIVASSSLRSFYLDRYDRPDLSSLGLTWVNVNTVSNQSKGYLQAMSSPVSVGEFNDSNLRYLTVGALIKFAPPTGQYFSPSGKLTAVRSPETTDYKWATVISVTGDGSNGGLGILSDGTGPIALSAVIDSNAVPIEIIPKFVSTYAYSFESEIVNLCLAKSNFGLSFDSLNRTWNIIADTNLNLTSGFNLDYQNDVSNNNLDASWMIAFAWQGASYQVTYRITDYIFESKQETAFFVDSTNVNYDFVNDTVIKDKISVLGINPSPINYGNAEITIGSTGPYGSVSSFNIVNSGTGFVSTPAISFANGYGGYFIPMLKNGSISSVYIVNSGTAYTVGDSAIVQASDSAYSTLPLGADFDWQVDSAIVEPDGYVEPKKVKVSFYDYNNSGQISDPDTFKSIVAPVSLNPTTGYQDKFVYFQTLSNGNRYQLSTGTFIAYPTPSDADDAITAGTITPATGDLFYFYNGEYDVVNTYSLSTVTNLHSWIYEPSYFARPGRTDLKFHYVHNSGENRRIDPSKSNIIDIYMLTADYDSAFRTWLTTGSGTTPLPPTTQNLENNYGSSLELQKTISDEIIFQPVNYVVLFGKEADINLQATFKAVQSPSSTMSANSLITGILDAINSFFALENWEFGQSFHFSELSTYVMNLMTPDITNFIIVPKINSFGGLYEISCQTNQIFISGTSASDIQIIDAITASQLLSTATIVTSIGS